jgi:hypothetical protein
MKINFLGDSITRGAGLDNPADKYSTLVAKYFGAEECNYGVGGTRIARQRNCINDYDENIFMHRAVQMEKMQILLLCLAEQMITDTEM